MRKFLYLDQLCNNAPIFILAKRKPSIHTIPRSGAWVVREWHTPSLTVDGFEGGWVMPCFPEITWPRVKQLTFIGEINAVIN